MSSTFIILLIPILSSLAIVTYSCPSRCSCTNDIVDGQMGTIFDCSGLYDEVLPPINTRALKLDFSENRLDQVPNRIKLLTELRELNLSHNRIHYDIQNNIFQNNEKMKILDLSNNYISHFSPNALAGLAMLQKLDLHNNLLATITSEVLIPLPTTTILCLGDNYWDCECDLPSLLQRFLDTGSDSLLETCRGGTPECHTPMDRYGMTFSDLSRLDIEICPKVTTAKDVLTSTDDFTTEIAITTMDPSSQSVIKEVSQDIGVLTDSEDEGLIEPPIVQKSLQEESKGLFEKDNMVMSIAIVCWYNFPRHLRSIDNGTSERFCKTTKKHRKSHRHWPEIRVCTLAIAAKPTTSSRSASFE
ncbi:hypothetical protein BSL78_29862 [Apostichopus japonicus]|uniref:Uncharacterized protein n=1 Tax=Stichopus japonicus TaxID=307972 RepID=A0A2G8JC58_STIJA|nr:hypothetical protein BSL78_29862 [Apostichopus japonicus]